MFIYTYGAELFNNANIRGTANGICSFGGALLSESFVPIKNICNYNGINPMVGCSLTTLITIPFVMSMPETLNKKIE